MDRSGAYAARWVAKSLVKAKLCRRALVQVRKATVLKVVCLRFICKKKQFLTDKDYELNVKIGVKHVYKIF